MAAPRTVSCIASMSQHWEKYSVTCDCKDNLENAPYQSNNWVLTQKKAFLSRFGFFKVIPIIPVSHLEQVKSCKSKSFFPNRTV